VQAAFARFSWGRLPTLPRTTRACRFWCCAETGGGAMTGDSREQRCMSSICHESIIAAN
jgi:hypothetical protein